MTALRNLHTLQARADAADRAKRRHRACLMVVDLIIAAMLALLALQIAILLEDAIASIAEDTAVTYALACERGADCR